ncbi:MAG: hypothetical protein JAY63_19020 [Candidatus Thiodiazotropha taylori]|nr:hypothetical protein [Candidatus Thiodiazotropha taylori]
MEQNDLKELLACLPKERTLYPYCQDYYAVQLLQIAAEKHLSIQAIKGSSFSRLLNKPSITSLLSSCGNGSISSELLSSYWQEPGTTFLLTTGIWGSKSDRYAQTSRPGINLVLRLNFNHQHDQMFRQSIHPVEDGVFNNWGHPVLQRGDRSYYRETLAWSRLDIDLQLGEVLIEEIQSDWVRDVSWLDKWRQCCATDEHPMHCYSFNTTAAMAGRYLNFVQPMLKQWSQAMLAATIDFIHRELGVKRIWFHSWEVGNYLKRIKGSYAPPRSLYTSLPKQFCFELTDQLPALLSDKRTTKRLRRGKISPRFYKLEL